eukprot:TRINITY_DN23039_c0_g1_i2.p1 TRINITY_DN23039_c0_g1~~TRINITY_DN23039_c0_g1_i2.p1  ORF type:complete len:1404 (-),score=285.25 TRINITY_DN23039_c0_g1_i2:286-4497(-)
MSHVTAAASASQRGKGPFHPRTSRVSNLHSSRASRFGAAAKKPAVAKQIVLRDPEDPVSNPDDSPKPKRTRQQEMLALSQNIVQGVDDLLCNRVFKSLEDQEKEAEQRAQEDENEMQAVQKRMRVDGSVADAPVAEASSMDAARQGGGDTVIKKKNRRKELQHKALPFGDREATLDDERDDFSDMDGEEISSGSDWSESSSGDSFLEFNREDIEWAAEDGRDQQRMEECEVSKVKSQELSGKFKAEQTVKLLREIGTWFSKQYLIAGNELAKLKSDEAQRDEMLDYFSGTAAQLRQSIDEKDIGMMMHLNTFAQKLQRLRPKRRAPQRNDRGRPLMFDPALAHTGARGMKGPHFRDGGTGLVSSKTMQVSDLLQVIADQQDNANAINALTVVHQQKVDLVKMGYECALDAKAQQATNMKKLSQLLPRVCTAQHVLEFLEDFFVKVQTSKLNDKMQSDVKLLHDVWNKVQEYSESKNAATSIGQDKCRQSSGPESPRSSAGFSTSGANAAFSTAGMSPDVIKQCEDLQREIAALEVSIDSMQVLSDYKVLNPPVVSYVIDRLRNDLFSDQHEGLLLDNSDAESDHSHGSPHGSHPASRQSFTKRPLDKLGRGGAGGRRQSASRTSAGGHNTPSTIPVDAASARVIEEVAKRLSHVSHFAEEAVHELEEIRDEIRAVEIKSVAATSVVASELPSARSSRRPTENLQEKQRSAQQQMAEQQQPTAAVVLQILAPPPVAASTLSASSSAAAAERIVSPSLGATARSTKSASKHAAEPEERMSSRAGGVQREPSNRESNRSKPIRADPRQELLQQEMNEVQEQERQLLDRIEELRMRTEAAKQVTVASAVTRSGVPLMPKHPGASQGTSPLLAEVSKEHSSGASHSIPKKSQTASYKTSSSSQGEGPRVLPVHQPPQPSGSVDGHAKSAASGSEAEEASVVLSGQSAGSVPRETSGGDFTARSAGQFAQAEGQASAAAGHKAQVQALQQKLAEVSANIIATKEAAAADRALLEKASQAASQVTSPARSSISRLPESGVAAWRPGGSSTASTAAAVKAEAASANSRETEPSSPRQRRLSLGATSLGDGSWKGALKSMTTETVTSKQEAMAKQVEEEVQDLLIAQKELEDLQRDLGFVEDRLQVAKAAGSREAAFKQLQKEAATVVKEKKPPKSAAAQELKREVNSKQKEVNTMRNAWYKTGQVERTSTTTTTKEVPVERILHPGVDELQARDAPDKAEKQASFSASVINALKAVNNHQPSAEVETEVAISLTGTAAIGMPVPKKSSGSVFGGSRMADAITAVSLKFRRPSVAMPRDIHDKGVELDPQSQQPLTELVVGGQAAALRTADREPPAGAGARKLVNAIRKFQNLSKAAKAASADGMEVKGVSGAATGGAAAIIASLQRAPKDA